MKIKMFVRFAVIGVLFSTIAFTGCKRKTTDTPDPVVSTTTMSQLSKDDNEVQSASDDAMNDANDVMSRGTTKTIGLPCNTTLDSTTVVNDTITFTLTYNGLNCNGTRFRTGQIKISKQQLVHWRDVNATVRVKFIDYKIERVATGKSITLNGTKTFVNVSGGLVRELNGTGSIVHSITGSMEILFDNGTTKSWNISRKRTFTGIPGSFVITHEGTGIADGMTNLVTWGTNRDNEAFYTQIATAVVLKQSCQWDPYSGQKIHMIPSDGKKATITFGYDNNEVIVVNSNTCPTKYKFDWEKTLANGTIKTGSIFVAY